MNKMCMHNRIAIIMFYLSQIHDCINKEQNIDQLLWSTLFLLLPYKWNQSFLKMKSTNRLNPAVIPVMSPKKLHPTIALSNQVVCFYSVHTLPLHPSLSVLCQSCQSQGVSGKMLASVEGCVNVFWPATFVKPSSQYAFQSEPCSANSKVHKGWLDSSPFPAPTGFLTETLGCQSRGPSIERKKGFSLQLCIKLILSEGEDSSRLKSKILFLIDFSAICKTFYSSDRKYTLSQHASISLLYLQMSWQCTEFLIKGKWDENQGNTDWPQTLDLPFG